MRTVGFCGGSGYIDDLVHKTMEIDSVVIKPFKDIRNVQYEGDLDKYFKEANECDVQNDIIRILSDMYDLIKNRI